MCYLWILLAVEWIYFYYFFNVDTIIAATSVAIEMIADTQKSAADKQFHHLFRYLGDRRLELRQTETYGNDPTFQAC